MYAHHRFDRLGAPGLAVKPRSDDAVQLRTDSALPAGLATIGPWRLTAENRACRMRMEIRFEDAWPIRSDWVLTGREGQLYWPARCWRQVAVLPGGGRDRVSLHCFGTRPPSRLVMSPLDDASALAVERLVCRHLHPRQWSQAMHPDAGAPLPRRFSGAAVASETLPSVFTLAWTRELPVSVEMPLSGASLLVQGVPSPPKWQDRRFCLEVGAHRMTLDCGALHAVVHQRCRCAGSIRETVLLLGEDGFPVLRLSGEAPNWRALLGDVLYSPRGGTLSK